MMEVIRSTFPIDDAPVASGLQCPLCSSALKQDPWWLSPHWICEQGHSYSNVRVLTDELRERGWLTRETELALVEASAVSSHVAVRASW
jgi:hypothetical protein